MLRNFVYRGSKSSARGPTMGRSLFAVAVVIAVGAGALVASAGIQQQGERFQVVNLRIECSGGNVSDWAVTPFNVAASRSASQQVRWRLLPASDVDSASMRPKEDSSWPFATEPPVTVTSGGNRTVDSGAITAAPGSYFYDVVVDCGNGAFVIDPRMDIRP
jgi:hypothetical protein